MKYTDVKISKDFSIFLHKNDAIIMAAFNILKKFIPNIRNTYKYSKRHPPEHHRRIYSHKLFIGCILNIILSQVFWKSFVAPIPGPQVNKVHHQYVKYGIYQILLDGVIKKYGKSYDLSTISIDTSFCSNKKNYELEAHNPHYKNKKGVKIVIACDGSLIPTLVGIKEPSGSFGA